MYFVHEMHALSGKYTEDTNGGLSAHYKQLPTPMEIVEWLWQTRLHVCIDIFRRSGHWCTNNPLLHGGDTRKSQSLRLFATFNA